MGGAYSGFSQRSPVAATTQSYSGTRDDQREYINAQLSLKYKIIDGLFAKGQLAYMSSNEFRKNQNKPFDVFSYDNDTDIYTYQGTNGANILDERFKKYRQLYPLLSLEYDKTINDHTFKGLALAEWIDEYNRTTSTSRRDLLSMDIPFMFAGSPEDILNNGSANERGRASYVGRFNYDYKSKYLLEATFRADGSYNFAPDSRWGFFPSVSAGWRISDESFMDGLGFLDDLKLRGSYSQMGYDRYVKNNVLQEFQYIQGYTIREGTTAYYMNGDDLGRIITPTGLANPAITWYDMTTYNVGLDAAFLEGIIGFEFDMFYRLRENIFGEPLESYPTTFGAGLPAVNINTSDDRGFELVIKHKNRVGEVNYSVNAFTAYSREKWVDFNEDKYEDEDDIRIRQKTGNWTNRWIGYVSDGQFMTQEEIDSHIIDQDQNGNTTLRPGDIRYIDVNGDSVITDRDRDVIGYGQLPDLTFGLDLNVEWKGLSLSVLFQGASRFNMNISGKARGGFANWSTPFDYHYQYRWTPDPDDLTKNINPDVRFPAVDGTGQGNTANNNLTSDFWLQDNTYLRLKNLNISYSLPGEWVQKAGIDNVRFYVAGTNLWTISKLGIYEDFWDPEGPQNQGGSTYPPLRTWTVGLNVTL
jgi:TonB-linked SusC/RagA family outer membrane protein